VPQINRQRVSGEQRAHKCLCAVFSYSPANQNTLNWRNIA